MSPSQKFLLCVRLLIHSYHSLPPCFFPQSSILPHFRLLPRRLVYPRTFVPSWFSQIHALKEPPAYVSWLPKSLEPHFNAYKQKLLGEYEKLTNLLSSGQDVPDRQLATRWKELRPIADVFEELDVLLRTDEDVEKMITDIIKKEDDDDDELIEIARLEKEQREKQRQALEQKLLWLISPPTPFALVPGAQLELIAGAGGREAGLFARDLLDMYRSFAAYRGWSFTVTQEATMSGSEATGGASETPLSKACVEIVGRPEEECPGTSMDSSKVLGAFGQLCWEAGVHRVQRIPVTSGQHKIHTSTVAVSVLPITEETDIEIPEGELKWEYYRSSGAGGQHVNKTDSAVRLTHLPTGTVVTCQQERSQLANKQLAFEKLLHKLRTERWRAQWEAMDTMRRSHVGNLDRSEKIRTYNFPQDRVTDHRLGRTWNGLSRFMRQSLGLSEMIQALVERDQFARLEKVLADQKEKE